MHPNEGRRVGIDLSFHQGQRFRSHRLVAIGDGAPVATVDAVKTGFGSFDDIVVVFAAIGDQVTDRADFQLMFPGKRDQIVQPRHRAVIAHDFTDDAGGVESRKARNIHRRLRMAGANQNAAVAGDQGKDMARCNDRIGTAGGVDCHGYGARPVGGGNACGDALCRLDRGGEGRAVPGAVIGAHQFQTKLAHPGTGQGQADQAAPVTGHEIDGIGRRHLARNDEIALIFAILVIHQDEHAAIARLFDQLLGRCQIVLDRRCHIHLLWADVGQRPSTR